MTSLKHKTHETCVRDEIRGQILSIDFIAFASSTNQPLQWIAVKVNNRKERKNRFGYNSKLIDSKFKQIVINALTLAFLVSKQKKKT